MKILLLLLLAGCSTTIYGPAGKPQLRTYADATNVYFEGPGTKFRAGTLNHSTPTRAGGQAAGTAIMSGAAALLK